MKKNTLKITIWCMSCEEIADIRIDESQLALGNIACPFCDNPAELYERWDGGRSMGCAIERAFNDQNDVGG